LPRSWLSGRDLRSSYLRAISRIDRSSRVSFAMVLACAANLSQIAVFSVGQSMRSPRNNGQADRVECRNSDSLDKDAPLIGLKTTFSDQIGDNGPGRVAEHVQFFVVSSRWCVAIRSVLFFIGHLLC
jgi:hypothetical protein